MMADGELHLEHTMVTDAKSSSYNGCIHGGTSGDKSVHALGKSIAPLRLDAVAPENHSYPTPDASMVTIPEDTLMLHFLEMEGVRTYPDHYPFSPLSALDISSFTWEHLKNSRAKSMEYITRVPGIHER